MLTNYKGIVLQILRKIDFRQKVFGYNTLIFYLYIALRNIRQQTMKLSSSIILVIIDLALEGRGMRR